MAQTTDLESAIPRHLSHPFRAPKHAPGSYAPPYPSFSARFDEKVSAVVMAYFGVQSLDAQQPTALRALTELREQFAADGGPRFWERARYVDAAGYPTTISIAYWDDAATFHRWNAAYGAAWTDPSRDIDGVGFFLELVIPAIERVETIYSAPDHTEGVGAAAQGLSGMIEEHAYWGSMRDRLPLAQTDPLWRSGAAELTVDGPLRAVKLHENACLIRSGQDYADTGAQERELYLSDVEPPLHAGMDFLRDKGRSIGCFDNRYMVVLDEDDQPTERTFGMSWWQDMAALEEWAASHETHVKIFGAAMRHLSSFGPDTRLRLYHEVTVPSAAEQTFAYLGCHDETGMLRAIPLPRPAPFGGRATP